MVLQLSLWNIVNGKRLSSVLYRGFCAALKFKVDKELLKRLRKRTGFPVIKCKHALEKFENNIKEAEKWMQEEALKQGWTKAGKLANRPMSQGLIGILQVDRCGVMVEVNCETDFVARNSGFRTLVSSVTEACMREGNRRCDDHSTVRIEWNREDIEGFSCEKQRVADLVAMSIGSLGENMRVRRAGYMRAPAESETVLTNYCHTTFRTLSAEYCQYGSYGSLLLLRKTSPYVDAALSGRNLCQHIVGMNPLRVGDAVVDKPSAVKDNETLMLFQPYLLDENFTVHEYAKTHEVIPLDFIRYQCGESLPEDGDS